jgi:CRP-like cAMP-binding protein
MMEAMVRKRVSKQATSLEFLKGISLFYKLPNESVEAFAKVAQTKSYKKGKLLYLEGDPADFFYIICGGWLKLFHITEEGEEVILAMLTADSTTGESSMFEHGRYTSSAQVVGDASILSIPLAFLREQLRFNNQLALNMLGSMVQYQRRHELQLEQYLLYSAPQRIGCFLLGLCPVLEQKDGVILNLPYDKTLIASTLGMKGATFSRALNILREETGIHITGTRVTIDSMVRLKKFVDGCYSHYRLLGS